MTALPKPARPIIIVDDEKAIVESIATALQMEGITNIQRGSTGEEALSLLQDPASVLCLDLNLPDTTGVEILPDILQMRPEVAVIVITAVAELDTAVRCMKLGAYDYLTKPVDRDRLVTTVRHAVERSELSDENRRLRDTILQPDAPYSDAFGAIITGSKRMYAVFRYAEAVGRTAFPVLITGETGVGKELLARAIHEVSGREGNFVAVNLAGLDDTLFSDAMFGHVRGAYTGAAGERLGLIKSAEDGTLFMDEVGDLSPESQVKLLRLIQEGEYSPLGDDRTHKTSARFIFATNSDLGQAVASKTFRHDLYFRLTSHSVSIPPLRERPEDIPLLLDHFAKRTWKLLGREGMHLPQEMRRRLLAGRYPGNVRELEGKVADAVVRLSSGLPESSEHGVPRAGVGGSVSGGSLFSGSASLPTIREITDALIEEALKRTDGNQAAAARLVGLTREALNRRLHRRSDGV